MTKIIHIQIERNPQKHKFSTEKYIVIDIVGDNIVYLVDVENDTNKEIKTILVMSNGEYLKSPIRKDEIERLIRMD